MPPLTREGGEVTSPGHLPIPGAARTEGQRRRGNG